MSTADKDFDEEDVWSVGERKDGSPKGKATVGSRMISRSNAEDSGRALRRSAPINIPDWSKVYKQKGYYSESLGQDGDDGADDVDEEEDDDGNKIPPHEWIAKKLARAQISSSSVCEGAGRTLKGRDLSKVRNAVLTKTGFLE